MYRLLAEAPSGKLWGIPRGGQIIAGLTGRAVDTPDEADSLVDDVCDTGATRARYQALYRKPVWTLVTKQPGDGWLVFPWEQGDPTADMVSTVVRQLQWLGEDPTREGLRDTPRRVLHAWRDLTRGYQENPEALLDVRFSVPCDQMVVVRRVPYASLCEHHLLPFQGHATVGYIPSGGRVVGLSKLARLVHCFARRLQIQERLTQEIATAVMTHLNPLGVGVVLTGDHTCMRLRGVQSPGELSTSCLLGVLRDNPVARGEFFSLAHGPERT